MSGKSRSKSGSAKEPERQPITDKGQPADAQQLTTTNVLPPSVPQYLQGPNGEWVPVIFAPPPVQQLNVSFRTQTAVVEPVESIHSNISQHLDQMKRLSLSGNSHSSKAEGLLSELSLKLEDHKDKILELAKSGDPEFDDSVGSMFAEDIAMLNEIKSEVMGTKIALQNIDAVRANYLQKSLEQLIVMHRSLEVKIKSLESSRSDDRKLVDGLQTELEQQIKNVKELQEAFGKKEIENQGLVKAVETLQNENVQLNSAMSDLKKQVERQGDELVALQKVKDESDSKLVMRQLFSEVATLMVKITFPKDSKRKMYQYSDLNGKLNALKTDADDLKQAGNKLDSDQKLKEWEACKDSLEKLKQEINWEDSIPKSCKSLIDSCRLNNEAHPDLVNEDNVKQKFQQLKDAQELDDGDHEFLIKMTKRWVKLKTRFNTP